MLQKKILLVALIMCAVSLCVFSQNIDAEIFQAVSELSNLNTVIQIGIGPIGFRNTGSASSLSDFLKDRIRFAAVRNSGKFRVVSGNELDRFVNDTNFIRTRSMNPLGGSSNSGTNIQAILEGSFSQVGDDVEVMLTLTSVVNNIQIGMSSFIISAEELNERKLALLPPQENKVIDQAEFEEKQEILESFEEHENPFNIQVWSNHGDNIFYDGDDMTINLHSDVSCYFLVYYVDVYGMRQQIYPNQYDKNNYLTAGTKRTIPEKSSFTIVPPYGEEHILVFASTVPYENNLSDQTAAKITRGNTGKRAIAVGKNNNVEYMEAVARYNYTILSGK
jgi:hypothetical protein